MTNEEFKSIRIALGYTQHELGELLGFTSGRQIINYEKGKRRIGAFMYPVSIPRSIELALQAIKPKKGRRAVVDHRGEVLA